MSKPGSRQAHRGHTERNGSVPFCSPRPHTDLAFEQGNTIIVLNSGAEDAISAVNIPANLESRVPYMETGQMVVYSPDNSEPVELVGLPECVTRHGRS